MLLLLVACGGGSGKEPADEPETNGSYSLGWTKGACADEVVGEGHEVGEVLPDYHFLAQTGETVRLYDFCHNVVLIELGYFG